MQIAQVLIFRGVENIYTYLLPENADQTFSVGEHVEIPFGRSTAKGLIVKIEPDQKKIPNLKPILKTLPKLPIISAETLDFLFWFKDHYHLTPFKAYQTIMGSYKIKPVKIEESTIKTQDKAYDLNLEQEKIIDTVLKDKANTQYLLFGVTSSGKTEVYIQIAKKILNQKKNVLILLPEIALTPQIANIFKKRFGSKVAVIHSGLTPKQRSLEWNKIYQEHINIVIGPRSAVFAPLKNLGLIIVDEEHENTYKQENNPRYYTHTVAAFRSQTNQAKLIFGSATPSIEIYHHAHSAHPLKLLKLSKRVLDLPMPKVEIIDMKDEIAQGNKNIFSIKLLKQIKISLSKKEKVMILINRRGYAPYIICQKCGTIYSCPECNLSFTYHKDKKLRCHRCNIIKELTHLCPKCKTQSLYFSGLGIQKAETELIKIFPDHNIIRLDKDTAKTSEILEQMLTDFSQKGDILIGTQIIAKGHHFPEVTCVGVLGIDTVLGIPDFRSCERAFQLLTQVAGRAGRSHKKGKVFVQTYMPDHYIFQYAQKHDFEGFYEQEINFRKQLFYPPYSTLINILLSSPKEADLKIYSRELTQYITNAIQTKKLKIQIIGPKPAPIEKIKNYYRWHILLKCPPETEKEIKNILKHLPKPKSWVRLIIDFEPRSIL